MDSNNKPQPTPSKPLPKHEQDALAFRQSVKRLRESKGWTQNHLAEQLRDAGLEEFHQITVARLETGRRAVRLGEAGVIADVLDSPLWAMLIPEQSLARASRDADEKLFKLQVEAEKIHESALEYELLRAELAISLTDILKRVPSDKEIGKGDKLSVGMLLGIINSADPKGFHKGKIISPYSSSLDIVKNSLEEFSKEGGTYKDSEAYVWHLETEIKTLISSLSQDFPIITEAVFEPASQDQKAGEP